MKLVWLLIILILGTNTSCAKIDDLEEKDVVLPPMSEDQDSVTSENDTIICSFEKYMDLQPAVSSAQGSACYKDYFIQGYNYNDSITIYNLKEKRCLGTINVPAPAPSAKTHSNTLNFGRQRYDSKDYFPLLYVSSGYPTNGVSHIYVYRLKKSEFNGKKKFSIDLVQTISLHNFGSWTEGVVDTNSDCLWIASQYGFVYYKMPSIHNGDADIYYENYLKILRLGKSPITSRNQGHLYHDDKILLVTGVPSAGEQIAFISIDTEKEVRDLIIDLAEVGLVNPNNPKDNTFEPEGVIIYNGQLMICYRTAIYSFTIEKKRRGDYMSIGANNVNSNDAHDKVQYDLLGKSQRGVKGISIVHSRNTYRKVIKP